MFAIRSSETRIFPVATIAPSIDCGDTVSVSIAWFCDESCFGWVDWPAARLAGAFAALLQPATMQSVRSAASKKALIVLLKNISVILDSRLLLQRRCGRKLEIEQRRLIVKKSLIVGGERFTPRSHRVEQVQS